MTTTPSTPTDLGWLLHDLIQRVVDVRHALLLSSDGLVTSASSALTREDAEHLAAVASGFHSLARGAGFQFNIGQVRQTMIEYADAFLFVTAAGDGSCLAVLSSPSADAGQVVYEMALLVKRMGEHMAVAPRNEAVVDPAAQGWTG
ncbi:roadblock/LC7 domain-containing protein [Streptomyces sp. HUAS TT7]|uniref:roadblock/LC7 domain-containing protein n=1 Tax=Streptomyces sp. HUAS TT7 TaxID=3447507 RepID=UPI003F654C5E